MVLKSAFQYSTVGSLSYTKDDEGSRPCHIDLVFLSLELKAKVNTAHLV